MATKAKKMGRPQEYSRELPVYDTMEQCSGSTGVPMSFLRKAKAEGCPAFTHGRVRFAEFIQWLFKKPEDLDSTEANEDWGKRDKRAVALLRESKLQEEYERVVDFELAGKFIDHLVGTLFFGELERMEQEFPATLKGKAEVDISKECGEQFKRVRENLQKSLEVWKQTKGKSR